MLTTVVRMGLRRSQQEMVPALLTSNKRDMEVRCEAAKNARGRYVIMGDADDSHNFLNLMPFLEKLRDGYELVMGNRFKGGIEKGAMPPLHKYLSESGVIILLGGFFIPAILKIFIVA